MKSVKSLVQRLWCLVAGHRPLAIPRGGTDTTAAMMRVLGPETDLMTYRWGKAFELETHVCRRCGAVYAEWEWK